MSAEEERVLIFAPTGRDGPLLETALRRRGLHASCCRAAEQFMDDAGSASGALLLTEESLSAEFLTLLRRMVEAQPPWSDLPILLLTSGKRSHYASSAHLVDLAGARGNVTLLERPIRMDTLASVVTSALASRRHQYEIRDHLAERQRNEEKFRETAKLESIGVLAGGIAHDFNNLLTGIIGNASLCLEMVSGDSELIERLQDVVKAGERAAELTNQLLAYAGKGRFVIKPTDISALTASIAPLVKRFVPSNAELRLQLQENLPLTEGDSGQLQQVIMNLIINAGEAIPEDAQGLITVTTGVRELNGRDHHEAFVAASPISGSYAYLEVRDNGAGMPDDVRARIFDPFFTTKFLGRGLGLAAVLGIVRSHRGALSVTSAVGEGTTFAVYFPVSPGKSEKPGQPEGQTSNASPELSGPAIVLIVDDEPSVRQVAASTLERRGLQVQVAHNGHDAIEMFGRLHHDIAMVLLDLTMPGMNGEQCYAELRAISPGVPVILSSGFSESMLQDRFAGKGFAGFLQKPYTSKHLADKVVAALAKYRDGSGSQPDHPSNNG